MNATRFLISPSFALLCLALPVRPIIAQRLSGDGFLFGPPKASLALRLGYAMPLHRMQPGRTGKAEAGMARRASSRFCPSDRGICRLGELFDRCDPHCP